ncbi:MAG: hypothetical protein JST68_04235, partial [Bacteroidetes bacterium]|nr:hypothetical protein [Bacteroidota bacterium]
MASALETNGKKAHPGIDRNNAVVSLRNVRKSFGSLQVLKGVDLDVYKGENVV